MVRTTCSIEGCNKPVSAYGVCGMHHLRIIRHGSPDRGRRPRSVAPCSIDGCERTATQRGWCNTHYQRWRKSGTTDLHVATPIERFWSHVCKAESGCWEWVAHRGRGGYGYFAVEHRKTRLAHRWLWEQMYGELPRDMDLDHLCRNRACVNPEHLDPVSRRDNNLRAPGTWAAKNASKTHCINGHPFDGANTRVTAEGIRRCRACAREATRKLRAKRREATR